MKLTDKTWKRVLIVLTFPLWALPALLVVYVGCVCMLIYTLASDYIENGWSR